MLRQRYVKVEQVARIAVASVIDFLSSTPQASIETLRVVLTAEEGSPGLAALQQEQAAAAADER